MAIMKLITVRFLTAPIISLMLNVKNKIEYRVNPTPGIIASRNDGDTVIAKKQQKESSILIIDNGQNILGFKALSSCLKNQKLDIKRPDKMSEQLNRKSWFVTIASVGVNCINSFGAF
jgi:hypothetical protein